MKKKDLQKILESAITNFNQLSNPEKEKLIEAVDDLVTPLQSDKLIYRLVVGALGLAILGCLTFTYFFSLKNPSINIPDIFMAIGSAAVGALAGLLAPSPTRVGNG